MSASYRFFMNLKVDDARIDGLWQLGCQGISEEANGISAYFTQKLELPFEGVWYELDTTNYVEDYYATLEAVYLEHLVIAPTHSKVELSKGQRVLWLDPGMAFGTGHHETTQLILRSLEQLELNKKTVLDVGAGSGILAIAADLLGAKKAFGVDIDPLTLSVAEDNARLNKSRASFSMGTLEDITEKADIIVANLFAELHVELAGAYKNALAQEGLLLLSGIMREKLDSVTQALSPHLELLSLEHKGEWSFVKAKRK